MWHYILAAVVVTALAGCSRATLASGTPVTASSPPGVPSSNPASERGQVVPVVGCASTYYAQAPGWTPAATLPATTAEPRLSAADAAALARYGATDGSLSQLAPRGWTCTVSVAADGGWGMTIADPRDPNSMVVFSGAYNKPAIGYAAPWFPAMCGLRVNTTTLCQSPPAGESVVRVSGVLVRLSGSAGVADPRLPLPPRHPFVGAVAILGVGPTPSAAPQPAEGVWCVTPPSLAALCSRIVDASVAAWTAPH